MGGNIFLNTAVVLSSAARVASLTSQAKLAYDEIQSVGWRA
jgi:hypothetical protein